MRARRPRNPKPCAHNDAQRSRLHLANAARNPNTCKDRIRKEISIVCSPDDSPHRHCQCFIIAMIVAIVAIGNEHLQYNSEFRARSRNHARNPTEKLGARLKGV